MHSGLYCGVSQAADPEQTGSQSLPPQGVIQGIRQGEITCLKLGSVEHHSHRGTGFITPVPGHGVRAWHQRNAFRSRGAAVKQGLEASQQLAHVLDTSLPQ